MTDNDSPYTPLEDATVRFLLQDKPGEERCPDCSSPYLHVKRVGPENEVAWALCDDCEFNIITDTVWDIRESDLRDLPPPIQRACGFNPLSYRR